MKNNFKYAIYSVFTFVFLGLGISLQIKAVIGQSMLNAFALTLSDTVNLKVGTILNIVNLLFFISYLLIRRSKFNYTDIIQVVATIANGYVINFFVYYVFLNLTIEVYIYKIIIFLIGLLLSSTSLGAILAIGIVKFPLESLCLTICDIFNKKLSTIRRSFDIIFLITTLCITFIKGNALHIREGTIVSFFLLSNLLGFSYSFFKKLITKG
jgi:uncharacterized membrane protein YczE